jgi:hypothetical protein
MSDTAWTVNQGGASGSTGNGVASPGHTGTEGSNPSPSSGESSANLTGPRGAAHRRSDRDCPLVMPSGQRDRGRGVAGFGWGTIIAPDTEICPNHGIPFRRMSFHEAIAFRIYRIRPRADQNRPLPISVPKTAIFLPCGAPVPAYCRSGIPVLRSLSPMKVTLRRAPGDACSIMGQQRITVEHAHVHAGAQAIVGAVTSRGGGDQQSGEQTNAIREVTHEPGTPMRSPDPERELMPVAGGGGKTEV